MRTLFLSITAIILAALPAVASELLIVQSQHRPVYDQAVRLIQNSCGSNSETLVMSDYAELDLARIVREEQPRLVIALGEAAFKEARKLRRTPVIYALTLNVDEKSLGANINGVSMHVAADNYVKLFNGLQLRRIGIIYDPRHSGAYLERARRTAAAAGIELSTIKVHSPREVPAALNRMISNSIDALWMMPDSTAVAAENVDAYFHFAQQQNLPVFSFARGYLAKGAVAVLEGATTTIIEQSCSLARKLLSGVPAAELATVDVNEAALFTNEIVAGKLQLNLSGAERLFPPKRE